MDKRSKIALYAIAAIILFMVIAEIVKPQPINWRDSFTAQDKVPLGCYVLFNELQELTDHDIYRNNQDFYIHAKKVDDDEKSTAIFINNNISFYGEEAEALLDFVNNGHTVFISSTHLAGMLADSLKISMRKDYNFLKEETYQDFTSPSLSKQGKTFEDVIENSYFTEVDSLNTIVLGHVKNITKEETEINFIKVPYGEEDGAFYIHSNPFAFSNYHLLDDKEDYAATVLSYLPMDRVIWDEYHKSGRRYSQSNIRYIISQAELKWAFYLALFSLILFVLFKGKRTQRIVPVVEPLENSTVEFTKTIGGLYFQHKEYSNIIEKKILFFLEHVRSHYYLNTATLDKNFTEKLALKASKAEKETGELIDYINILRQKTIHSEEELIALNKKLEQFTKI